MYVDHYGTIHLPTNFTTSTTGKLLFVTLFHITEGMLINFGLVNLEKNKGHSLSTFHNNIPAACWKDKRGRCITPTCSWATEGNFLDDCGML
jgi:hypothetical protein